MLAPRLGARQHVPLVDFVFGADHIEQRAGGWCTLNRLPAEKMQYLAEVDHRRGIRSACPAGIRARFYGEITALTCHMQVEAHCRSFGGIDLLCDDIVVGHSEREQVQPGDEIAFHIPVPASISGAHVWELWFPITFAGPVQLAVDGEISAAPTLDRKLLCIGDSITQGMVSQRPSGTYAALLSRMLGADLRNHAIGGHVFDAELVTPTPGWEPQLITVAYGTNDWSGGQSAAQIAEQARALFARVAELFPAIPIVCMTPMWRHNHAKANAGGSTLGEVNATLMALANDAVQVIDGFTAMPHHERYTTDGLHPNELGMAHVAHGVHEHVRHVFAD